jgi:hypothetical protein
MTEYKPILRHEFTAADGSFLLQLRCDLTWDQAAFSRLVLAMEQCAAAHAGRDVIERWVAEGFWYLEQFVPDWSTHPNFPRPHGEKYYEAAYQRLRDLSYWLFVGDSPNQGNGSLGEVC